ncbi:metal dependent phosphohydrolase [Magnetococcus marinus MC-1]|uniref:Metal dependent phosphohydrolase n=2 Tax=Magnetococcus TaxID=162171 RepID=A0L6A0_MAGMM|nr:metal dependent phosphohydrolase [Magnetococcus marinus MC-1]
MPSALRNGFSPFVQNLLDDLHWIVGPIYMVGGGLRDSLRHRFTAHELDLVVLKPLDEARELLQKAGYPAVVQGQRPNTLILPLKRQEPPNTINLSCCCGGVKAERGIEEDLRHRDITVNAIAYCWPDGPLIDPFNGVKDLEENRIRLVNGEETVREDPLRALRFFRFIIQLAGEPDPEDLYAAAHTTLYQIQPELLRGETDRILSLPLRDKHSQHYIFELFKTPLGKDLLPEFAPLKAFPEQPNSKESVWENALNTMLKLTPPQSGEEISLLDLRWAALLHQLGKPASARWDENGLVNGYGIHRDHSVRRSARVLQRLAFTKRRQRRILTMIQFMEMPFPPSERVLRRMINQNVPVEGVFRLLRAKAEATQSNSPNEEQIQETFQNLMRRCKQIRERLNTPAPEELNLTGGDLIDLVRGEPGPWIQQLQHHLALWIQKDPRRNNPERLSEEVQNWVVNHPSLDDIAPGSRSSC